MDPVDVEGLGLHDYYEVKSYFFFLILFATFSCIYLFDALFV